MRILFLNDRPINPSQGGIERVTDSLAREFRILGHETAFFSFPNFSDKTPCEGAHFARRFGADVIVNQSATHSGVTVAAKCHADGFRIFSVVHNRPFPVSGVEKEYVRLFHAQTAKGRLLKAAGRLSSSVFASVRQAAALRLYRRLLDISERLVVLSPAYVERLARVAPLLDLTRVCAIPNPVEHPVCGPLPKDPLVLWAGRHCDPQKNGRAFIEAWRIFAPVHPGWRAVMCGDGPQRREWAASARGVPRLEMPGHCADLTPFYRRASVLAMTSLHEGFPMVLAEALAHGCVPVAFNTFEALEDMLGIPECGLKTERPEPALLAEALSLLASDRALLRRLAALAARQRPEWHPEAVALRWLDLFQRRRL